MAHAADDKTVMFPTPDGSRLLLRVSPFQVSTLFFVALCGLAPAATDPAAGIPIDVREEYGIARDNELVTVSVPLPEWAGIHATSQLGVRTTAPPTEIASQWRVLTRWGGGPEQGDRPIKFALVRFFTDLAPNEVRQYQVFIRPPQSTPVTVPPGMEPIGMTFQSGLFTVDTGVAQFDLRPTSFNPLPAARVDLDGDGAFSADEEFIDAKVSLGPTLLDTLSGGYLARADGTTGGELEEVGPLTVVVRLDGVHRPVTPASIGRDFLQWSTRLTFVAGSAAVHVEHILGNGYLDQPLGHISFGRYFLHGRFEADGPIAVTFGDDVGAPLSAGPLAPGEEAFLYQDSSGGVNWSTAGTSFSGWRAYRHALGPTPFLPEDLPAASPIAAGSKAAGWMDVADDSKGMLVAMRHPWENYPYALRATHDGNVTVDLWPAEFEGLHWMDDAQRKAHRFALLFHGDEIDANAEAIRLTHPVRPWVHLPFVRLSRAWGDQGDLRDVNLTYAQMKAEGAKQLQLMYDMFDEHGNFSWVHFGEPIWSQNTHHPGSWRNRLTWFDRFMSCGAVEWFELAEIFALHSMDLRTYHIVGFRQENHPYAHLLEGIPHYTGQDMLGRDSIPAAYDAYKVGVPSGGHGWNGFDPEHMTLDDLYEYYLMTGSHNALDAIEHAGQAMLTWKNYSPSDPILSARAAGWTLRALMKVHAVTGDPAVLAKAQGLVTQIKLHYGQDPSPVTGKEYHYVARNIYSLDQHNMTADFDMPWQIAVTMHGLALYLRDTGDASVEPIIIDLADYLVDYCIQGGIFVDALACDDHLDFNPKDKNDGVNTWIPSALAIAYRLSGKQKHLDKAKMVYDQNDHDFLNAVNFYHWYHPIGEVLEQGN